MNMKLISPVLLHRQTPLDPSRRGSSYLAQHQEEHSIRHAERDRLSETHEHPWQLRVKSYPIILQLGGSSRLTEIGCVFSRRSSVFLPSFISLVPELSCHELLVRNPLSLCSFVDEQMREGRFSYWQYLFLISQSHVNKLHKLFSWIHSPKLQVFNPRSASLRLKR